MNLTPKWDVRLGKRIALWFGCGLVPVAPGTAGTIGALPLFFVVRPFGPLWVFLLALSTAVLGVWASNCVVKETGVDDPQEVVVDEVAGMMISLIPCPQTWTGVLFAFFWFRVFDQFKPWPAKWAEGCPGGVGVVLDDVFAGLWALLLVFFGMNWGLIR